MAARACPIVPTFPMKKLIAFLLLGTAGLAQSVTVHRNLTADGAVLGAVAGAIIGNNSGHGNGGKGALIGAAAGAVLGNAASQPQSSTAPRYGRPPANRRGDGVVGGAVLGGITGAIIGNNSGHGNGGRGALVGAGIGAVLASSNHGPRYYEPAPRSRYYGPSTYYAPRDYYEAPVYYSSPDRGDAVAGGALFGGLVGAIIGNNSGHGNGGRGALIGAGIGALLGATASEPVYSSPASPYYDAPRTYVSREAAPTQVTIINNYYATAAPTSGGYRMDAPADGR
jgi:uncharacterized protein YcfJ